MTGSPAYPGTALWPGTDLFPSENDEVAPTAITGYANPVSTTTATLNGTINPNSLQTYYYYEYGWGPDPYGNTTASSSAGAGAGAVAAPQPVTGLTSARHYHFRLVAYSAAGFAYGDDQTFNTDFGRDDRRPHSPHAADRAQ